MCRRAQPDLLIFPICVLFLGIALLAQHFCDDSISISWVNHTFAWFSTIAITLCFEEKKKEIPNKCFFCWKWSDDWNMVEMATMAMIAVWVVAFNFVVCELGQWLANRYAVFGDELFACNWYALPIEIRRIYSIFSLDSQQPVHVQC